MTAKQRDDYSGIVRRKSSKGKTIDSIEAMNKKDLEDALKALKESEINGTIPWKVLKKEVNL